MLGDDPNVRDLDLRAQATAVKGSLLFHLALAEALAGEALAGRFDGEPVGWALDVTAQGYEVSAVGFGQQDLRARVTFAADGTPLVEMGGLGGASPRHVALAAARETGAAHAATLGGRWRVLPIPPRHGEPLRGAIETYLVRLADRPTDLAAGPHWRLDVDADGGTVLRAETACSLEEVARDAAGRDRPPFVLVHGYGDVPSPVHVMLSLQLGVTLQIDTPRSGERWRIEGEALRRLGA